MALENNCIEILRNGQKIKNYTINGDTHIGEGNFALVYKAINEKTNELVALKICKDNVDVLNLKRFKEENEILHMLCPHNRIIKPYSRVIDDAKCNCCYTMELAISNLSKYLLAQSDALSFRDKLDIFKKICEGIDFLHDKKIIHRDLYWDNVLMVKRNKNINPKLSDLGRAKDFSTHKIDLYQPQTIGGIIYIKPPENMFRTWDKATIENYKYTDMYSLGLIIYYIFNNSPSFFQQYIEIAFNQFLIEKGVLKQDLDNKIPTEKRVALYKEWITFLDIETIKNFLQTKLEKLEDENKINKIILKLCHPDYNERCSSSKELLKELNKI